MSDQVGKEGAPASDPLRDWGLGFPPAREMIVEECEWVQLREMNAF